jgi:hypothetical protein
MKKCPFTAEVEQEQSEYLLLLARIRGTHHVWLISMRSAVLLVSDTFGYEDEAISKFESLARSYRLRGKVTQRRLSVL